KRLCGAVGEFRAGGQWRGCVCQRSGSRGARGVWGGDWGTDRCAGAGGGGIADRGGARAPAAAAQRLASLIRGEVGDALFLLGLGFFDDGAEDSLELLGLFGGEIAGEDF